MEEINIADILGGMPEGTVLYSPVWGEVEYINLAENGHIVVQDADGALQRTDRFGRIGRCGEAGLLWPSASMKDWTRFQWRAGMVLRGEEGLMCTFGHFTSNDYTTFRGYGIERDCRRISSASDLTTLEWEEEKRDSLVKLYENRNDDISCTCRQQEQIDGEILFRMADNDNPSAIFIARPDDKDDVLRSYAYLVPSTDRLYIGSGDILSGADKPPVRMASDHERCLLEDAMKRKHAEWDPAKKKIRLTAEFFKPFDHVLVRDQYCDRWQAAFFSDGLNNNEEYRFGIISAPVEYFRHCIPYEGHESLLCTTETPTLCL